MARDTIRDYLFGFVRVHILYHAAHEEVYGKHLKEELARHGYDISYGTLYPMLHKMERDGHLKSAPLKEGGKYRRGYRITAAGQKILAEAKAKVSELLDELNEHE